MFFLGHMVWGYDWATVSSGKSRGKLFVPAILILAVLPDIDLFFSQLGVLHHTFTHSLFFWLVIFAPFLVVYRRKSIAYLVAVAQHFAFGDLIVGKVMIFWPFNSSYFGLNFAMASFLDVALETTGLLLAAGIAYYKGDLRRLLSVDARNIPMLLPFLALLASMLFFTVDWPIIPLIATIFSRKLLTIIVLDHLLLTAFLAVSTVQGLRVHRSSSHERARLFSYAKVARAVA